MRECRANGEAHDYEGRTARVERARCGGGQRKRNEQCRANQEERGKGQPARLEIQPATGEARYLRVSEWASQVADEGWHVLRVLQRDGDQKDDAGYTRCPQDEAFTDDATNARADQCGVQRDEELDRRDPRLIDDVRKQCC
jgi:hypothetical protein